MKVVLNEEEKTNITSQHDEIDRNLFNFLIRRIKVETKKLGEFFHDIEPLEVTEYNFEGYPGYGFNSLDSKRQMENKIIRMLYENDITDYVYDIDERDEKRIKIVKTIRNFLNFILKDKK